MAQQGRFRGVPTGPDGEPLTDDILEETFGPPQVAAADLNELRVWTHGRTSIQPTKASLVGRELCTRIDPTWPDRAVTNDRVMISNVSRFVGTKTIVRVAESTTEALQTVGQGREASTTIRRGPRNYETLWPAQGFSWRSWIGTMLDRRGEGNHPLRREGSTPEPIVSPVPFLFAVRDGLSPYTRAVADAYESGGVTHRALWKFATVLGPEEWWYDGLVGIQREWFDMFGEGEAALWLRSVVCNGWMTSFQLARLMGLPSARTAQEQWIGAKSTSFHIVGGRQLTREEADARDGKLREDGDAGI